MDTTEAAACRSAWRHIQELALSPEPIPWWSIRARRAERREWREAWRVYHEAVAAGAP